MIRVLAAAITAALSSGHATAEPRAELLGSYLWQEDSKEFGGFSGMDMTPDGQFIWLVSDDGFGTRVGIQRDTVTGLISGVTGYSKHNLTEPDGQVVEGRRADAEGLALAENGDVYVSFEGNHRIQAYRPDPNLPGPWPAPEPVAPHPEFETLQNNSSLEALAIGPDGEILTIPERSGILSLPFPVYRLAKGVWDKQLSVRREPPFLVVGADFGPDGRLYVLERHLNGFFGFQSRVRRFDYGTDALTNEVTLFQSRSARHDNLEGLSVWRDAGGRIRLTMISDNNFKSFQRTEIVEYVVTE